MINFLIFFLFICGTRKSKKNPENHYTLIIISLFKSSIYPDSTKANRITHGMWALFPQLGDNLPRLTAREVSFTIKRDYLNLNSSGYDILITFKNHLYVCDWIKMFHFKSFTCKLNQNTFGITLLYHRIAFLCLTVIYESFFLFNSSLLK